MNEILNKIASGNFNDVLSILGKMHHTPKLNQLTSLIYRYIGEYEKEKELAEREPDSEYITERKNWHNLPLYKKLTPRPPIRLEEDPDFIPKTETLNNTAFAIISSANMFDLLVDCIASIKGSRFRDIPICVLSTGFNSGLTDNQKQYLYKKYNIRDIKEITGKEEIIAPWHKKLNSRCIGSFMLPYLGDYFPQFRYIFYIEHDTWVYDDRIIGEYIKLCEKQGCAYQRDHVGLLCFDTRNSSFVDAFKHFTRRRVKWLDRQPPYMGHILKGIYFKKKYRPAHRYLLYHIPGAPIPVYYNDLLAHPLSLQIPGVIHLREPSNIRNWIETPTLSVAEPLDEKKYSTHQNLFKNIKEKGGNYTKYLESNTLKKYNKRFFVHYHIWPKENTEIIKNQILSLTKEVF